MNSYSNRVVSNRSQSAKTAFVLVAVFLSIFIAFGGCAPAIGDECSDNSQCPSSAICDKTVKSGYCTIEDCERGTCPEGSTCIAFDDENAYCMQTCGSDDDCREGYSCRETESNEKTTKYCYIKS